MDTYAHTAKHGTRSDVTTHPALYHPRAGSRLVLGVLLTLVTALPGLELASAASFAVQIGGPDTERGFSITTDAEGNIYTTGSFRNTTDLDPDPTSRIM